ncbi:MAG: aldo/keto reductase [Verrucomicrobia bacterium]|nr:aldo/keto reductase [Verrucomicrobiota bacterium]
MSAQLETNDAGIPVRSLGNTGLKVSILGLGGGHFCRTHISESDSVNLVHRAVELGIRFMDTAWEYHDGESERRMGLALRGCRDKVILMTKVCARDRATAEAQLHESLRRLRSDVIDVWQFHEVNYDSDPALICGADGALEAAVAAKKAGKIRFIGFTGHKSPHIFLEMLRLDFPWDTCQLPITVMDPHYRSFISEVLPLLNQRGIGAIGMKSLGGDGQFTREVGLTPRQCRGFALSQPISTLVCGIESIENLQQDIEIARGFVPFDEAEQGELLRRVRSVAVDGRYEWYKSTQYYDSTYHRNQHGFPPLGHVSGKLSG